MSSHIACLDGNAAGGELSKLFAMDVTDAQGQCKHCGATRPLPKPTGTGKLLASSPGAVFASTCSFDL
jgi:uncharacterized protein DUF6510